MAAGKLPASLETQEDPGDPEAENRLCTSAWPIAATLHPTMEIE